MSGILFSIFVSYEPLKAIVIYKDENRVFHGDVGKQ